MKRSGSKLWLVCISGVVLGAALNACSFDVDPDQPGRFTCDTIEDCGAGYVCIEQVNAERGLCFPFGACADAEEACDGVDEDCDGALDDVTWAGTPCVTEIPGICTPGTRACESAVEVCVSTAAPTTESCNLLDDDCDGPVDEDFDLQTDEANCGMCGAACPPGTECSFALCLERDCTDGVDNDADGNTDCADSDCLGRSCSATQPDVFCTLVPPSVVMDGGTDDGGVDDGGVNDGGEPDAGFSDAGVPDAGAEDGGEPDAGAVDGGSTDGGSTDGGEDGGSPDAGPALVPACALIETDCANGLDDDADTNTDCADPDCAGQVCDGGVCASAMCL